VTAGRASRPVRSTAAGGAPAGAASPARLVNDTSGADGRVRAGWGSCGLPKDGTAAVAASGEVGAPAPPAGEDSAARASLWPHSWQNMRWLGLSRPHIVQITEFDGTPSRARESRRCAGSQCVLGLDRCLEPDKVRDPRIVRQKARVLPGVEVNRPVGEGYVEHRPAELHFQAAAKRRARSPGIDREPFISVGADARAEQDKRGNLAPSWEVATHFGAHLLEKGQPIELVGFLFGHFVRTADVKIFASTPSSARDDAAP
jgi:hypothetical protein